ncbi:transglutaminase-like domain-containing protein [[Clostridium] polysaccharolyticum]|uniref:Transglutaminase-like superfamily protein n=1 Tax=[Clostridium] polysaccharolyticum TaxID=29364 RepID=A0A1I0FNZ3_9FIRM|nr:transglutaminase-like domain-containing protein [[Clostridium] polysaccharolyticum]SET59233.1 Transglutaminase-like superfamily protein [[Clostridium] polysaccharolyticum]
MKIIYEKGLPLILAILLGFQECSWFQVPASFLLLLFFCGIAVLILYVWEKKQWNLVAGVLLFVVAVPVILRIGKICFLERQDWLYVGCFGQCILLILLMKYIWGKCVVSSVLILSCIVLRVCDKPVFSCLLVLGLVYFLLAVSEWIHTKFYQRRLDNQRSMGLMPVYFLLLVVLLCLPVKETPFDWSFVVNPVQHMYENVCTLIEDIKDARNNEKSFFSYKLNGEDSKESRLGGSIEDSSTVLLKVKGRKRNGYSIYLTGSVYDTYTGNGWIRSNMEGENDSVKEEHILAKKELEQACLSQQWGKVKEETVYSEESLYIRYGRLKTKTIFYPAYLNDISLISKSEDYHEENANLYFQKKRKRGYQYQAFYRDVNLESELVKGYLRSLGEASLKDRVLRQRTAKIASKNLQLPSSYSDKVKELAFKVTKDCENSYDKMMEICQYVRRFPYTKKVEDVKEKQDFVEDFLFRTQRGYCTYFATSVAVMGRCIGIPTRYVEGMVIQEDSKEKDEYYILDGNCMHAWCEAYFAGFGWVRFEATPGYGNKKGSWKPAGGKNYYEHTPKKEEQLPLQLVAKEVPMIEARHSENQKKLRTLLFIVWVLLAGLILFFITFLAMYIFRSRRVRTEEEQCTQLLKELMFYLRKLGFVREDSETLTRFYVRVKQKMQLDSAEKEKQLKDTIDIYLRMRYGKIVPERKELEKMRKTVSMVRNVLKECMDRVPYLLVCMEAKMLF